MRRACLAALFMLLAAGLCPALGRYSAASLYDQGNAYARQGRTGLAVLSYERAAVLTPADADLRANLDRLRTSAGLPDPHSWWEHHLRFADPDALYWVGLCGLALGVWGALTLRFGARRRAAGVAAAAGAVLLAAALAEAAATWPLMHQSVVLHATSARVTPVSSGDAAFALAEGQVVSGGDRYRGFELVSAAGRSGWVPESDLAPIIARTPI